jgi:hypothetical protein
MGPEYRAEWMGHERELMGSLPALILRLICNDDRSARQNDRRDLASMSRARALPRTEAMPGNRDR